MGAASPENGAFRRYLILSSRVVRPGHPYRLSVNVLDNRQPVVVRAALFRDSVRLSGVQRECAENSMNLLEIPVPSNSGPGRYRLHVEGNEPDQLEGSLFRNQTELRFEARSLTMLVQMDSPVYRQLQTVRFRVVLLGTDLKSFKSSADVRLLDPNGIIMKRWPSLQSNTGLVSAEYPLGDRPVEGSWKVRVTARGQTEEQPFLVEVYQPPKFEVLVETPALLRTSDSALHVMVTADYSSGGGAVSGQLTLLAEAAPLHRHVGWRAKQVVLETVHSLKFLGGPSQVFRAHMPFRAHRLVRHRLDVQPELVFRDGKRFKMSKRRAQMSPNHPGVWEVEVVLYEERDFNQRMDHVRYLRLSASLKDYRGKTARAEAVAAAVHTPSNLHLHLATSTHFPKVGEYLVLHVRCNFFIDHFRYVVFSKGILLDHGLVKMKVVSDTLRFPVSGLSRNNFTVSVSRTTHPNQPRFGVEVSVKGRQGATVGLAAFQSHLYQVAAGTDVSSFKLMRAMQKFDHSASSGEFAHQWTTDDGLPGPTVHLASHRTAFGFNETLE
ncbi:CD109 antigen [Amphibalanus amphitrite]|uniref:CD109 antigen n=1 Tax=Amphibalanus amphitrite TaxID=1232801 RepID=A0A6A4X661_AMPAM|nr:CD109 antigen [Amphibalanus amphitrite]